MNFSSVGDFLRKAATAKSDERKAIDEKLAPMLEDRFTIGIPPGLLEAIEDLVEQYGDEAYKQISLFTMGKWHETHCEMLQQHADNGGTAEMLSTMNDLSKISTALTILGELGSFSGDEAWRKMLRDVVGQSVLETLEEKGISIDTFLHK
jgi:hypothetical protein